MQKSAGISAERVAANFGLLMETRVDVVDGNVAIARRMADATQIDGVAKFVRAGKLEVGEFANVEIIG